MEPSIGPPPASVHNAALGTWLVPIGASLTFTLLALRTRAEEKYLIERFGEQYRQYMARVGRFLPKLG